MKRILTIDWDYFFTAPLQVRDEIFPDITEGYLDSIPDNSVWLDKRFLDFSDIKPDWESIEEFAQAISETKFDRFYYSENHGEMYNVVEHLKSLDDDTLAITNIDFHHDYYYTNGDTLCCDNWLRLVKEKYPDTIAEWCKREDSVDTSFGINVCREVPIECISFNFLCDLVRNGAFDYVHLCRSDLFSPPIADDFFERLLALILLNSTHSSKIGPIPHRKNVCEKMKQIFGVV